MFGLLFITGIATLILNSPKQELATETATLNFVQPFTTHNIECTHHKCNFCNKKDRWGYCQEDSNIKCVYLP